MSIASKAFLAAMLAAGLMVSGGAQAAVQSFSIELSDLTPHHNASGGLSAEVVAFAASRQDRFSTMDPMSTRSPAIMRSPTICRRRMKRYFGRRSPKSR